MVDRAPSPACPGCSVALSPWRRAGDAQSRELGMEEQREGRWGVEGVTRSAFALLQVQLPCLSPPPGRELPQARSSACRKPGSLEGCCLDPADCTSVLP